VRNTPAREAPSVPRPLTTFATIFATGPFRARQNQRSAPRSRRAEDSVLSRTGERPGSPGPSTGTAQAAGASR
jgi:hypothetical protein